MCFAMPGGMMIRPGLWSGVDVRLLRTGGVPLTVWGPARVCGCEPHR